MFLTDANPAAIHERPLSLSLSCCLPLPTLSPPALPERPTPTIIHTQKISIYSRTQKNEARAPFCAHTLVRRALFTGTCAGAAHAPPLRADVPKRRPNSAAAWPRTAIRDCDGEAGSGFCGASESPSES